ncbi:hypothetical protein [Sporosarcina sp. FA9]|uniref:hypothetical protein n=1 Tax=Sporosarcina sp. FA9 TaxID=3413030 RepID=UPI003F66030A
MSDRLTIKLEGDDFEKGRIPVAVLNKVLKAAQATIFTIGEYKSSDGSSSRERGPFPRKVQESYTLELVATSKGSFVMDLDLPQGVSPEIQKSTFQIFHEVIQHISDEETKKIIKLIPDQRTMNRVLKSIKEMLPRQDDYKVFVKGNSKGFTAPVSTKQLKSVDRMLSKPKEEVRELIGKIVELKIHGDSYVGIYNGSRVIRCISLEIENEIFQSIGKEVLIKGEAVLTNANEIQELVSIDEVTIADPGKWLINEFHYHQKQYEMMDGFYVELDYVDGYWTIEHEELGLYISEPTLREVLSACYLGLSYLWEEYAVSPDEELTIDAIELKKCVIRYIERVVPRV